MLGDNKNGLSTHDMYGVFMRNAIEHYKTKNAVTVNLVRTVRFIRENLYAIDANPRPATLTLYLQYNLPSLEQYSSFLWNNLNQFESYELEADKN